LISIDAKTKKFKVCGRPNQRDPGEAGAAAFPAGFHIHHSDLFSKHSLSLLKPSSVFKQFFGLPPFRAGIFLSSHSKED
jgi:hypothetical protein